MVDEYLENILNRADKISQDYDEIKRKLGEPDSRYLDNPYEDYGDLVKEYGVWHLEGGLLIVEISSKSFHWGERRYVSDDQLASLSLARLKPVRKG